MPIEILVPTVRTLGGATRAVVEQCLGPGFMNIDAAETDSLEVELMKVDMEAWSVQVPDDLSSADLGEKIKQEREIVRTKVPLRLGHFTLFPGFVILCRPDEYDAFEEDPRARQIIGREALELAQAFDAEELVVAGDAASDFIGHDVTDWPSLKDVLDEEEIPHTVIPLRNA